jgi:dihydroflavonol-4-reductase
MENKKIMVTGAAGYVGSNLVRKLAQDPNNEINILIHEGKWHPFLDGLKLNVFYGDIRNKQDVLKAMDRCQYVYQVAGVVSYNKIDNQYMYTTHVDGVRTILEAAMELNVKKVVVTASTAGLGIPEDKNFPVNEKTPFDFKRYKKVVYMYSKHLTIKTCEEFANKGLDVSMVSPTTIYGPGDTKMHIGGVFKNIYEGKIKKAPPGGNAVVSTDDAAEAHMLVMEKGLRGENYVIANEYIPFLEMFNIVGKMLGAKRIEKTFPQWMLAPVKIILTIMENFLLLFGKKPPISAASLNFSFKFRYFDPAKIKKELGWQPKTSFVESMQKALAFYHEQGLIHIK